MTQHEAIIHYLIKNEKITPMEAFSELGITKLSTRIGELIQAGYPIVKLWIESTNRYGEKVRYRGYKLERTVKG